MIGLINKLKDLDIRIELVEGQLEITAPKGKLTPQLVSELKSSKEDLIEYLKNSRQDSFKPVVSIEEQEHYGVSNAQKRLWLLHQFHDDLIAYNEQITYSLTGRLNVENFNKAFLTLVQRHEILRTRFIVVDDQPRQQIRALEALKMEVEHISALNDEYLNEIIAQDFSEPFNLEEGPLLRLKLIQVANDSFIFLLTIHHIIADVWSMNIFLEELLVLYNTCENNTHNPLKNLPIQYKDYSFWQNDQLSGEKLKRHQKFWLEQFADEIPDLDFPLDYVRPLVKTFENSSVIFNIEPDTSVKVKAICKERNVSLFVFIIASVKVLLYKYTHQEDIIIGSPVAGRNHADLEDQIGFYVNTLPIRTRFSANESFYDLLNKVNEASLDAFEHQIYPFDKLVEELGLGGNLMRTPLFEMVVALDNINVGPSQYPELINIDIVSYDQNQKASKFDLAFNFSELNDEIKVVIDYNKKLFSDNTISRISEHYKKLVGNLLATPQRPLNKVEYLSFLEAKKILDFTDTFTNYPSNKTIIEVFEDQVLQHPDALALVYQNTSLTYQELNAASNKLGFYLREKYVIKPDDLIGLMVDQSELLIIAIIAILKSGAGYVPINPAYSKERKKFIISDTKIKALLTELVLISDMDYFEGELFLLDKGFERLENRIENLPSINTPNDLGYIMYTSGSTGGPKGVMIEHRSVVGLLKNTNLTSIDQSSRMLQLADYAFDGSVYEIFGALLNGGSLFLVKKDLVLVPEDFENYLKKCAVNTAFFTTALFNSIVDTNPSVISYFNKIHFGGEQASAKHIRKATEYRKYVDSLVNGYGPTETTTFSAFYVVENLEKERISVPIGKAVSNDKIYILDENIQLVSIGVTGEVCIGGAGIARGYLNNEALTAEKFVENPFNNQEKIYRTGDIGKWLEDGTIELIGRKDKQVKIRGYRIEPGEIEQTIEKIDYINKAVVVVSKKSNQEKYLTAYFTLRKDRPAGDIKNEITKILPEYMVPSYFVELESFQLTSNGKINYKLLPNSEPENSDYIENSTLPLTDTELKLTSIWESVLERDKIGPDESFFKNGGHSLNATQILSRINKELNVKVKFKDFFTCPTIRELARIITKSEESKLDVIEVLKEQQYYDVSFSQKQFWILDQLGKGQTSYNVQLAYMMTGEVNFEAFEKAYQTLIVRHESLRTTFITINGELKQQINPYDPFTFSLEYVDLQSKENAEQLAQDLANKEAATVFDLNKDPLIKTKILHLSDVRKLFLLTIHHIIIDEWSAKIFVNEFTTLYNAFVDGNEFYLKPLQIQFKDYANWCNQQLTDHKLQKHRQFWLDQFSGEITALDLPYDYPRPPNKTYNGACFNFILENKLSKDIIRYEAESGVTTFTLLLSLVKVLLHKYSGATDVIIGSPVAGRVHPDFENQIGLYINTVAFKTNIEKNDTFNDLLYKVKNTVLNAYEHQIYPFDYLIADLKIDRQARSPLFDIMVQSESISEKANTLKNISFLDFETNHTTSKYDLTFFFKVTDESVNVNIEYNTDLFKASMIECLRDNFLHLAATISSNYSVNLSDVSLLYSNEEESELNDFLSNMYNLKND